MKTQTLELAVDAVADAVRALLPELVARAVEAHLVKVIEEAIRTERAAMLKDVEERLAAIDARIANASTANTATYTELGTTLRASIASLDDRLNAAAAESCKAYTELGVELDASLNAIRATLDERLNAATSANAAAYNELAGEIDEQIESTVAVKVAALPPAAPGPRGEPGRDGRDATFTAPVHWHEGRVFARGSCVIHAGGLWYATVDTDAPPDSSCSGYSLIVDGVWPHEATHDERGYTGLAFKFASGRRVVVPLHFRAPQYCGVYEAERAYEPNDLVTCGGSLWWARSESKGAKPGTDAGARLWVLSVKCGRDGERGERGPPGERGLDGPAGRDGRDAKPQPKRATPANGAAP